ncbi:MAG: PH domain-containing protein, partial [Clostridia bacterium]|nr:PH domain-containing protein [Clostridia bacterium]
MTWRRQSDGQYIMYALRAFLLLLPILSAVALMPARMDFVSGGWAAILLGALISAVSMAGAYLIFSHNLWREKGASLLHKKGVLQLREYAISKESLVSVSLEKTPFTAITRSQRVCISTRCLPHIRAENADVKLLLPEREAKRLASRLMPCDSGEPREHQANAWSVIISAASRSNFFTGLLISVPFILRMGKYIDKDLPVRIVGDISGYTADKLGVPPIMALVALLPVLGWTAHFIINCISMGRMRFSRGDSIITISRGVISRRTVSFCKDSVTAIDIRQSVLMRLCRSYSCSLFAPDGEHMIMPSSGEREMRIELSSGYAHSSGAVSVRPDEAE